MSTTVLDQDARPEDRFISAFKVNEGKALNGTNAPVSSQRQDAIERFAQLGIPTNNLEAWKYTNISKEIDRPYALPLALEQPSVDHDDIAPFLLDDLDAHLLVLINGRPSESLSALGDLPEGVVVSGLDAAGQSHPELIEAHYGEYADYDDEALKALNTAFVQDGTFLYVPSGTVVEKPIFVLELTASNEDVFVQPRHLFVVEDGGVARLIQAQHRLTSSQTFTNAVTEVYVGSKGNFEQYLLQNEGATGSRVENVAAYHEDDSTHTTSTITLSGNVVRNNITITADGAHCESNLYGLFLGRGGMHVDNHTLVEHVHPDCVSNELYKGVLNETSTGIFNGKVFVDRGAQRINAYQSNKSIVLTNEAQMFSKPELEIYADDVECSHGATTGEIDEEALFYLRSRGLPEDRARVLMLQAFVQDVIDEISIDPLREHVEGLVRERFSSEFV